MREEWDSRSWCQEPGVERGCAGQEQRGDRWRVKEEWHVVKIGIVDLEFETGDIDLHTLTIFYSGAVSACIIHMEVVAHTPRKIMQRNLKWRIVRILDVVGLASFSGFRMLGMDIGVSAVLAGLGLLFRDHLSSSPRNRRMTLSSSRKPVEFASPRPVFLPRVYPLCLRFVYGYSTSWGDENDTETLLVHNG